MDQSLCVLISKNRQLLTHSSGFCYDLRHPLLTKYSAWAGRQENMFSGTMEGQYHPLVFQPGTSWDYGPGLEWAAHVVETLTGLEYDEYQQKHIWQPLGAQNTTFFPAKRGFGEGDIHELARRAEGEGPQDLKVEASPWKFECRDALGGAGLFSTANDYGKLLAALLAGGGPLLSQASVDELFRPQLGPGPMEALREFVVGPNPTDSKTWLFRPPARDWRDVGRLATVYVGLSIAWMLRGGGRKTRQMLPAHPATGQTIGTCPEFSKQDVEAAIAAADRAFHQFRAVPGRARARLLRKWHDLMLQHAEDLSLLVTLENGKPLAEAKAEEPVGVCALITPKAGAALAAGCTVVIKTPPETPYTANALIELARRAGIPNGVINAITTDKNIVEVGRTLTQSPLVKKLSFTGSTEIGKLLMRQCAETTLKKISLELGGNAPFIVFDDADLDAAVQGALISKFRGSGQTCVCANRIFVHDSVYDRFAARLATHVQQSFVLGDGLVRESTTHGPLIHGRALQKVKDHVTDAVSKGARVLAGGRPRPDLGPNFFEPTVMVDMTLDMKLASDETFGPVAGLFRFKTEPEVIRLANDTQMGLAAYIFTQDASRAWRVSKTLEVGMVGLNTGLISDAAAPFGGIKSSGFGREGSKYGIDEYLTVKTITVGGINTLAPMQSRL
ncbi:unnamed protein product [Parascedosporium putredinis]|uniref:Succinate-semialdehyde dehydrogenase, mitochondrial n=1 Tax=Parascedosporium putredinis TaxID=1442378 RepID=A0A9P1H122_9PEZI|nr:unnamed protein product [Parascedosporium putredinis]CAI7992320.1 unnamed protein product [Parascedosporium putredinis]